MNASTENAGLDEEFVAGQRERLESMLDRYRGDQTRPEDEAFGDDDGLDAVTAYTDDTDEAAQPMAIEPQSDFDVTSDARVEGHIEAIERALEKIDEGSYGLSDDSGEPIGRARLESVPEARYTLEEQERRQPEELG